MKVSDIFGKAKKGSYRRFVVEQLEPIKLDEAAVVDLGEKDATAFRMNLNQYCNKTGKKFKTKIVDGKLYVGRIE